MAKYQFAISVRPQFLPDYSNPSEDTFMFAYTVTIKNTGEATAQLISRHWIITDANNKIEEVEGDGVVGEHRSAPGKLSSTPADAHCRRRWARCVGRITASAQTERSSKQAFRNSYCRCRKLCTSPFSSACRTTSTRR